MRNQSCVLLSLVTATAVLLLMCDSHLQAQSANGGSVQAPVGANKVQVTTPNPVPPQGPYHSNMPLAAQDRFTEAEQLAPKSVPAGAPGVSSASATALEPERPLAFGTSTAPYTTARVAVTVLGDSSTATNTPVTSYPYRPTGKLYFKIGTQTFICTASLIKKGVLVTAAHCVFNFGKGSSGWYSGFVWCPANTSSSGGVYGCYNAGWQ
jgi:V8-like Glu-specific endopeptidase